MTQTPDVYSSLRAERYQCASCYYDVKCEQYKKPEFEESDKFKPSTNVAPTEVTPVLMVRNKTPVIKPMVWGMIPPWKNLKDSESKQYSTHNCRIENVHNSNLYRIPLKRNNRCVALCEGYYEWPTDSARGTNPTFIYAKQPSGMKAEEVSDWDNGTWSEKDGWTGPSLTYMAGFYSVCQSPEDEEIYSFSVLTMASAPCLRWLHHRMPVILSTRDEISAWLDYDIDSDVLLGSWRESKDLSWHTVSNDVNNSRNKDSRLNKPINEGSKMKQTKLMAWLKKTEKRSADDSCRNSEDPSKKSKV